MKRKLLALLLAGSLFIATVVSATDLRFTNMLDRSSIKAVIHLLVSDGLGGLKSVAKLQEANVQPGETHVFKDIPNDKDLGLDTILLPSGMVYLRGGLGDISECSVVEITTLPSQVCIK